MSEHPEHSEKSTSLFDSPKKLVIVILLSFIVPVVVGIMLAQLVTGGRTAGALSSKEAIAKRIEPIAKLEIAAVDSSGAVVKTGEQIFTETCSACHSTGAAGAPKMGDKAAWAPRLAKGMNALIASVIQGKNAMPAKGGNPGLSDADIKAAVVYLTSQTK